ncbi:MAG: transketolase C-terminal domain-containing protein, partial [Thermoleophilia bacterium]
ELVVTVEEGTITGGFGSAVTDLFAEESRPVRRFALPDRFIPQGNRNQLLKEAGLSPEAVAGFVAGKLLGEKIVTAERRKASGEE